MTCEESRIYLFAYLDDELDVAGTLMVQSHLAGCAQCRRAQEEALALRSALRDLREPVPAGLAKRVDVAVRQAAKGESRSSWVSWLESLRWLPAAAALAIAATIGALFLINAIHPSRRQIVASAVVASHIRSLQPGHLIDVPSSDRHTVKPWFQGKLDFAPPVPDLADSGSPLIGGRLDYIDGRPVAALIYQRRKHDINVFVWPANGSGDASIQEEDAQGYEILHWTAAGMTYWAVSDLNRGELMEFARAMQTAVRAADATKPRE